MTQYISNERFDAVNRHISEEERQAEWLGQVNFARDAGCGCSDTTYIVNNDTEYAALETIWETSRFCSLHRQNYEIKNS